jgi:hypothetical protein
LETLFISYFLAILKYLFSLCGKYVITGKFYRENLPAAYAAVPLSRNGAPMKAKLLWGGKGGFAKI